MSRLMLPAAAVIRRATLEELPVIADLARLTWRVSFPGIITDEQIEYMLAQRYSAEAMLEAVDSGQLTFELLRVHGKPAAFAAHGPIPHGHEFKLQQLYVHPAWQGRGLGGRLIDHMEDLAREGGQTAIVLTVNRNNTRAKSAYEHRGFRVRSEMKIEIGNGFVMDDFVMVKRDGRGERGRGRGRGQIEDSK